MLRFLLIGGDAILKEENGQKFKPLPHQRGNNSGISCQAHFYNNAVLSDCRGGISITKPVDFEHLKNQRNEHRGSWTGSFVIGRL